MAEQTGGAPQGGALMMMASALVFAGSATLVRALTGVSPYTVVMLRFVVGALAVALLFCTGLDQARWINRRWIVVRGLTGGLGVTLNYWAIQHIGLARAMLLLYTYVVFAAVFAVPILGERLRLSHWMAIVAAMVGVAMMCGVHSLELSRRDAVALSSGVLSGIAVVAIARCRETDSAANIFLAQCLFGMLLVAAPTLRQWTTPSSEQWGLMVLVGLLATTGQIAMTHAYKFTGATYGSLLSLLSPVTSAVIGILGFHEPFTVRLLLGGVLVLSACVYLSLHPVDRAEKALVTLAD